MDKVVWYLYLFKNFLQFVVIHTVKGFIIVNEAEVDVFLEFHCFLHDPTNMDSNCTKVIKLHLSAEHIWVQVYFCLFVLSKLDNLIDQTD